MLQTRRPHYTIPPSPFRKGRRTCPVCGRTGDYHCSVTQDGGLAICKFRTSDKPTKDRRYIHILNPLAFEASIKEAFKLTKATKPERADADRLHAVYSALLSDLTLTAAHGDELLIGRGLSDATIARNLYASVPGSAEGNKVAASLACRFDLRGVPGFYRQGGRWRLNTRSTGFYVPYRDEYGRVIGLQIRRDGNPDPKYVWLSSRDLPEGTPATTCIHFVNPDLASDGEVIITEGALKADRIGEFLQAPVVALAGVSATRADTFTDCLRRALPDLRSLVVAFDIDWQQKPQVERALNQLVAALETTGLPVNVRTWNPTLGKGLDDVLYNAMR
jgi:DNA primase